MATDPVSGNAIPPGAHPEEVRDDIDIKASEGEYIIPANVVRYLGLEKIEKLVMDAKEALGDTSESGVIEEEDDFPFGDDELVGLPQDEPEGFAEGGLVGENTLPQDNGFSGPKKYKNKDGQVMFIPYFNGAPLFDVPQGYTEEAEGVTNEAPQPAQGVMSGRPQPLMQDNSADENDAFVNANESPLAGRPSDWSVDDFIQFGNNRGSGGERAARGMIHMMPGGSLALKARDRFLDGSATQLLDQMLDTGFDAQGNPISPEQKVMLSKTREQIKGEMSDRTGLNLRPLSSLTEAFQKMSSFSGLTPKSTSDSRDTVANGPPMSAVDPSYTSRSEGSSDTYSAIGNAKVGSDIGRDPSLGPSNDQIASGGLYRRGGLVKRPKK
jgi:hypothetical protein